MAALRAKAPPRIVTISPTAAATFGLLSALIFVFQLGSLSALAFLACGMLLVVLKPNAILDETARYGWIYLLPFWCVLTLFWSSYPTISLRYGIQLGLTILFAVTVASRLSPAIMVRLVWLAFAAAAVCSVLFGQVRADGQGWLGIYGSKNAFAMMMSVFLMASFAFVLDRDAGRMWRLAGMGGTVLGLALVVLAHSTGALAASVLALTCGFTLRMMRHVSPSQRVILTLVGGLSVVLVTLIVMGFADEIESFILRTTGKDTTLTGRTDLWIVALEQWSQRPLIGHGYQAFWVVGNPIAEQLWDDFDIAAKIGFNFHNTWLSNAVEIGFIGIALQMALFGTALVLCVRWALWNPCVESLFFAMFILRQTILSMVELVAYMQFDLASLLATVAAVYGLRVRSAERAQRSRRITKAWTPARDGEERPESGTASQGA